MNISIVIPNYNGKDILSKNLPKIISILKEYKKGKKELILIDDASTDTSLEIIQQLFDDWKESEFKMTLLKNDENKGFAPTVNKGVSVTTGEIIILLNTDVNPEENFLEPLLSHFTNETVFAVGCLERSIDGEKTHLYGRGIGKWENGFLVHNAGDVAHSSTLWVSGGSGAFRKRIWTILGGFNEVFAPFYWEDIDLSYRAKKCGYEVLFEAKSVVTHRHEEGAIKKTQKARYIRTIAVRNQFLFVWNNITDPSLVFEHLRSLPVHLARAVVHRDGAFINGFLLAAVKLPVVFLYRKNIVPQFKISDEEVTSGVRV